MKTFYSSLIAIAIIFICPPLQAQTYTLNWATSFSPAWATGNIAGNANNIGGSTVNCNVNLVKSGGIFTTTLGPFGGPMTPTVSASTFIVAGSSSNLQISLDYTNNTQYTDVIFTFNKPVLNVSFRIADIDRLNDTLFNYLDKITITGYNGALSGFPAISKYDNSNPNFMLLSGATGTAYVNPAKFVSANTASDATDQRGTINVRFNGVYLTSFVVRYANYAGTIADPTVQNIAIGNISFQRTPALPVRLTDFEGNSNENGTVSLNWITDQESGFDYYSVERSANGENFEEIGKVYSKMAEGQATNFYSFEDIHVMAPKYFYRLKMMDIDGSYNYSRIITVISKFRIAFNAYPSCFNNEFTVSLYTATSEELEFVVYNMLGKKICSAQHKSLAGKNEFRISLPSTASPGQYLVTLAGSGKTLQVIKQ